MATKHDAGYTLTEKELEALEKRIHTVYAAAAKDLQKTADQYFSRFTQQDQEQAQLVADGKLSASEYRQWRLNTFGRGERFSQMAQEMAERATRANEVSVQYVNNAMPSVYALNRNYTAYALDYALKDGRTVFGTGDEYSGMIDWNLMDESTVRRLLVEQPELMPNYPQNMAVRRGIDLAYGQRKIGEAVTSGIIRGASIGEIANQLTQTVTGMSRTSALRAARTACTSAQNAGRMDMMTHAVEDLGIEAKKIWISARDGRTRESHVELDGVQVEYNKKFPNKLMYPGDRSGRPEEVYNCRCSLGYVLPETEDDFNGDGKYATGNTVESYKEWMAQQDAAKSAGGWGKFTSQNKPTERITTGQSTTRASNRKTNNSTQNDVSNFTFTNDDGNVRSINPRVVEHTELHEEPNAVTEIHSSNGGVSRNFYDENGNWIKQLTNDAHGFPARHPYGQNGEHAHDIVIKDGMIVSRTTREMTEEERKLMEGLL